MILTGIIIASICGSVMFADILPLIGWVKHKLKRETLKPFDCAFCLSGWVSLALCIITGQHWLVTIVTFTTVPFITSFASHYYKLWIIRK